MVDVGGKDATVRTAIAEAIVTMRPDVRTRLLEGDLPKGDAAALVRVAAIQGAKRTPDLVPLCHPIALDALSVHVAPTDDGVRIVVEARVTARTGVEMEAMTGAAVGALTLYDMVKGLDRHAEIASVRLLEKRGGRSGVWRRD
jgi:cyclic pyranopterin phosphate synthase